MKIRRLNEERDKNGKLICYGAKVFNKYVYGNRYYKYLVFGSFTKGRYSVNLVSDAGVKGSSQVCFKTVEEFEKFKQTYGNPDLELVTRRLDPKNEKLIEVDTDYGKLWMQPLYASLVPPVDTGSINRLAKKIINKLIKKYSIEYSINSYRNISDEYIRSIISPIVQDIESELSDSYENVRIVYGTAGHSLNLDVYFKGELDEFTSNYITNMITESINLPVRCVKKGSSPKLELYFEREILNKLEEKFKNKLINELNNMTPFGDEMYWESAKKVVIERL